MYYLTSKILLGYLEKVKLGRTWSRLWY